MADQSTSAGSAPSVQAPGPWEQLTSSTLIGSLGWTEKSIIAHAQLTANDPNGLDDITAAARALDSSGIPLRSRTDLLSGSHPPCPTPY